MRSIPEIVIFQTDFGVNFGIFICFDILFHEPALQLTRLRQITDFVYPTAWFSEVPFLTGTTVKRGRIKPNSRANYMFYERKDIDQ